MWVCVCSLWSMSFSLSFCGLDLSFVVCLAYMCPVSESCVTRRASQALWGWYSLFYFYFLTGVDLPLLLGLFVVEVVVLDDDNDEESRVLKLGVSDDDDFSPLPLLATTLDLLAMLTALLAVCDLTTCERGVDLDDASDFWRDLTLWTSLNYLVNFLFYI